MWDSQGSRERAGAGRGDSAASRREVGFAGSVEGSEAAIDGLSGPCLGGEVVHRLRRHPPSRLPQHRERLFIVAFRADLAAAGAMSSWMWSI